MKKYLKILTITLLITATITGIYFFIDYEIPNLFYNKLQLSMIPGIIYLVIGLKMIAGSSVFPSGGIYMSKTINKQQQKDRIDTNIPQDYETRIVTFAYLTTGIIQTSFGILIGKI